ncbi:hypothetical protein Plhal304r1_c005g0022111 [Plasmopara halstedii]
MENKVRCRISDVIVISDDECDDNMVVLSTNAVLLTWSDVVERLLIFAYNRELRNDQSEVESLLDDFGIPLLSLVRQSLRNTITRLGEISDFLEGHNRRSRASQSLVMVLCEMLSLFRTSPCELRAIQHWVKDEESNFSMNCHIKQLHHQMDYWETTLQKVAFFSASKINGICVTMSRFNMLSDDCTHEILHLRRGMAVYNDRMKGAAEEFVRILDECRNNLSMHSLEAGELEIRALDDTFNKTRGVQKKIYCNSKACQSLAHHVREVELRRDFYQNVYKLACAAITLKNNDDEQKLQQIMSNEHIDILCNDMLENMDSFCYALQAVMRLNAQWRENLSQDTNLSRIAEQMHESSILNIAKHFEVFWLVHRNWLPSLILEVAINKLETLIRSDTLANCPVANSVSRVCASLKHDISKRSNRSIVQSTVLS